ncbi:MAG TPA: MFS transporter [Steroidobacteraceae bacterium]|nr:MFS transporter [Steroidobacteraceae bacterium]
MNTHTQFYGWKLLGVFWLMVFLNLGFPVYGSAVINAAMAGALHLDRQTLGLVFSVYMIMSGLPGPLVAVSVNRLGVRWTLIIGSGLVIAGAVLMATVVTTGLQAAIAFGLLVGTGVATGAALASQAGVAKWFVRRRALALSIMYSAGAIGGFVSAPLLNRVINMADGNWRMAWWVVAILSTCAAAIAALFVKEQPSDLGQVPDGIRDAGQSRARPAPSFITTEQWTYREALMTPAYWLMVLSLVGGSCGYTLYLAHGVVHLADLGHSRTDGAWAVSILAVTGLGAKVIVALLGDRIDPKYLWAAFTAFFAAGLYLVIDARSETQLLGFATCLGIGFGGGVVCLMAVLSNYYGVKVFASLAGLAVAIQTVASAFVPYIAGRLYDNGYGYSGSFLTFSAWCLVGAIVLFAVPPPTRGLRRVPVAETP